MKPRLGCLALLLLLCGQAAAEPPAGLVVYFESGGEAYLLLAEHAGSKRGWAGFGGGARAGETIVQTAAHKGVEESRGYFKRADLLAALKGQVPVMDGDFAWYFAKMAFVPAQAVMNHPVPEQTDAYLERSTFAWIPYSVVEGHLTEDIDRARKYMIDPAFLPAGSETGWFWPIWLGNMRKAVLADALPWDRME